MSTVGFQICTTLFFKCTATTLLRLVRKSSYTVRERKGTLSPVLEHLLYLQVQLSLWNVQAFYGTVQKLYLSVFEETLEFEEEYDCCHMYGLEM